MHPSNDQVEQYFAALIVDHLHHAAIQCAPAADNNKGKALFASQAFKAGEEIWSERPFVAMQHEENRDYAACCEHCFVPLIDSQACWAKVQESAQAEGKEATTPLFADFEAAVQHLQKEGGKSDDESYFSVFRLAQRKVQCVCGVLFCSETCRESAMKQQHALTCTRCDDNSTSMGKFINHTLITNEIFQLAAKVLARILLRFVDTQDVALARLPVDMFCKAPWWEVTASEDDLADGQTLEEYQAQFKDLLSQTLDLLVAGLRDNLAMLEQEGKLTGLTTDGVLEACADVLTVDFFGNVVGMFEMNNISMEIDHPFHMLAEALRDASSDGKGVPEPIARVRDAMIQYTEAHQCCCHDHEDDGDVAEPDAEAHQQESNDELALDDCCDECGDGDLVGVQGTALFSGICTMNHSCDPNCTVVYLKDGTAQVYAVQDINKGDELCISYIDVDQDVKDRDECLREYQFVCHCVRCETERNA